MYDFQEKFKCFEDSNAELYEKLQSAIDETDFYEEQGLTVEDFEVVEKGIMTLEQLAELVDAPMTWSHGQPKEYEGVDPREIAGGLPQVKTEEEYEAVLRFIDDPTTAPIIVVRRPDSDYDHLIMSVGYGKGICNLASYLGIDMVDVILLDFLYDLNDY